MPRLVANLYFRGEREVARVVRRVAAGREGIRDGRVRVDGVDAEEVLRHAFDLEFDVRRQTDVDADDADARQVAGQPRRGKLRPLQEINPRLDAKRAGREHVHVFGDERALLRAGRRGEDESTAERRRQTDQRISE